MNSGVLLFSLLVACALGCSCFQRDLFQNLRTAPESIVVATLSDRRTVDGKVWISGKVKQAVNGCVASQSLINITSSASSASCGVTLDTNTLYIVTGSFHAELNQFWVTSCGSNRRYTSLSQQEKDFVANYYNKCLSTCASGVIVNCYFQPCATSKCSVHGAVCEDNYCNGCNYYWWAQDKFISNCSSV